MRKACIYIFRKLARELAKNIFATPNTDLVSLLPRTNTEPSFTVICNKYSPAPPLLTHDSVPIAGLLVASQRHCPTESLAFLFKQLLRIWELLPNRTTISVVDGTTISVVDRTTISVIDKTTVAVACSFLISYP